MKIILIASTEFITTLLLSLVISWKSQWGIQNDLDLFSFLKILRRSEHCGERYIKVKKKFLRGD